MQNYPPPNYPAPPVGAPQQPYAPVAQQVRYGGFWIRFAARFIDGLVIGIPFAIIYGIAGAMIGASTASTAASSTSGDVGVSSGALGALSVLYILGLVAAILYFVIMWTTGATLGMRVLNLQVVDAQTGQHIGIGKAFLRYIGMIIAALPCYLGFFWVGWDPRKQGWHDKFAGTLVLQR
jgi:uncharacterized RDD family membrane protein YckC